MSWLKGVPALYLDASMIGRVEDAFLDVPIPPGAPPVVTWGDFAFWYQPDREDPSPPEYAMGVHGDAGDLICASLTEDGALRLRGWCENLGDLRETPQHGYGDLPDGETERTIRTLLDAAAAARAGAS